MRKFYSSFLVLCIGLSLSAQQKINLTGQRILDDYRAQRAELAKTNAAGDETAPVTAAFVVLKPGATAEAIEAEGITVKHKLGKVLIVELPLDRAEEIAELGSVELVEFGETTSVSLDFARPSGKVDKVQSGFDFNGKSTSFDGTGVVTGVYDTGLDPNHIDFLDAEGNLRVKSLWQYDSEGNAQAYQTERRIKNYTTDNAGGTHGTHVTGIMAGAYNGPGDYAYLTVPDGNSGGRRTGNIPYYGVSTNSDIVIGCGNLGTTSVASGIAEMVEYAEAQGQPATINVSLGLTSGPHDGTTAFNMAMEELGKRAIICLAAGNEGDEPISIVKQFSEGSNAVRTSFTNNKADGVADIWTNDSRKVTVTFSLYNKSTGKYTELGSTDTPGFALNSSNSTFARYFDGTLRIYQAVNATNKRYQVQVQLGNVKPKSTNTSQYLVMEIAGEADQKVWVYGGSSVTFARLASGFTAGTPDNSVSDLACSANVVCVGSYNSRTYWPVFGTASAPSASVYYYPGNVLNAISGYSSYGTTFQGRQLPDICAPGSEIVSAYSRFYMEGLSASDRNNNTVATAKPEGVRNTNYWGPMQGTSMATPFVTGVMGLWLQANPKLTYDDVMKVLAASSSKDGVPQSGAEAIRWGYGRIDALEGVKEALRLADPSGIEGVGADADSDERTVVRVSTGSVEAFVAGATEVKLHLYSIAGQSVGSASAGGDTATISTSGLSAGVYVLRVSADNYTTTRRVVIK